MEPILIAVSGQPFHQVALQQNDTVIHFYFGSVQFSEKQKFAVSVRRKFRWQLAMGWAGPMQAAVAKFR